jgi:heat-inducible transcriptional repressor
MTKAAVKRREAVLKIIVSEYIVTANPVASETVLRRYRLGVSPATIRNDMAALEEEGYITRPYTSSGSIPLDKGYRFYVESLPQQQDLPSDEQRRIKQLLDTAVDEYDRLLKLAARTMARLVGNAAIVTFPTAQECRFKHLEIIAMHQYMAMLVLMLSNAMLRRQTVNFDDPISEDELNDAAARLNREFAGLTRKQIADKRAELSAIEKKITSTIWDIMSREDTIEYENAYLEGVRLMLAQPEFYQRDRMLGILELMEAKEWLKRVIDWQIYEKGTRVIIGEESREAALQDLSLVMSSYGIPDEASGAVGIIGPKRMDYRRAIASVNYISGLLSDLVARVCKVD